jgi:hypothetical protein
MARVQAIPEEAIGGINRTPRPLNAAIGEQGRDVGD